MSLGLDRARRQSRRECTLDLVRRGLDPRQQLAPARTPEAERRPTHTDHGGERSLQSADGHGNRREAALELVDELRPLAAPDQRELGAQRTGVGDRPLRVRLERPCIAARRRARVASSSPGSACRPTRRAGARPRPPSWRHRRAALRRAGAGSPSPAVLVAPPVAQTPRHRRAAVRAPGRPRRRAAGADRPHGRA